MYRGIIGAINRRSHPTFLKDKASG